MAPAPASPLATHGDPLRRAFPRAREVESSPFRDPLRGEPRTCYGPFWHVHPVANSNPPDGFVTGTCDFRTGSGAAKNGAAGGSASGRGDASAPEVSQCDVLQRPEAGCQMTSRNPDKPGVL